MGEEGQSRLDGVSKREIAAAWACCALVMLGAILADLGDRRDDSTTAAYAGAHIPDGAARGTREPDAEYDTEEDQAGAVGSFANQAEPVAISSAELSVKSEPTGEPKRAVRYCREILRQSLIRYSAAVARLADAGAASGVREAAQ
jgi:hypothetical protein